MNLEDYLLNYLQASHIPNLEIHIFVILICYQETNRNLYCVFTTFIDIIFFETDACI